MSIVSLTRRYLACSPRERRLLRQALVLHTAMRIGLWILPFRTLARWVGRAANERGGGSRRSARPGASAEGPKDEDGPEGVLEDPVLARDRIVWAVTRAHRYGPSRGACLQEALVGRLMLSRHGFPAEMRFGVRKSEDGEVEAHAWVESGDEVVIGGPREEVETYSTLRGSDREAFE